jgi:F-type H+-transporting ATPase subunit b
MSNTGMPQLDFSTFPTQLFWLAITFIVLYVLMKWLALPQVAAVLDARRNRLDQDLARAAELKSQAEAVSAAYQKALAEARAQAQATIRETTERLDAAAAERQRDLAKALAERTSTAERDIAAAKERALAEIISVAADVASSVTAKLIGLSPEAGEVAAAVGNIVAERAA